MNEVLQCSITKTEPKSNYAYSSTKYPMRSNIYFLFLLILILISCEKSNSFDKSIYEQEQKTFTQTVTLILYANNEAYRIVEQSRKGIFDSIKYHHSQWLTHIREIVTKSSSVSDKYLDYLDPELKGRYRTLISCYSLLLKYTELQDVNKNDIAILNAEIDKSEESFWTHFSNIQPNIYKRSPSFKDDLNTSFETYNIPSIQYHPESKSFWRMLHDLFLGSIVLAIVYLVLALLTILFLIFISNKKSEFSWKVLTSCFIAIVIQAYLWILWTSFCVSSVMYYIDSPLVTHKWLYYVFGFIAAFFLLTLLDDGMQKLKIRQNLNHIEQVQLLVFGANIYIPFILISFLLFCFFPNLLQNKFVSFVHQWLY